MGNIQRVCKMALAGLAALGLWGASLLPAMAGNGENQAFSVDPVLEFASRSMAESYTVSIQWYGHMNEAQSSGLKELLRTGFLLDESAGSTVSFSSAEEKSSLRGTWSTLSAGRGGDSFLRLEADGTAAGALAEAGSRIDGWLRKTGAAGNWSVKAVGVWKGDAAMQPEEAVTALARTMFATEVLETYKDQGIVNALYRTDYISLKAEGTEAAFQTALHRNTETGEWNLAVGAPMLTGEF